jgi:hypothetical protein
MLAHVKRGRVRGAKTLFLTFANPFLTWCSANGKLPDKKPVWMEEMDDNVTLSRGLATPSFCEQTIK